jgi:hypothetical protein
MASGVTGRSILPSGPEANQFCGQISTLAGLLDIEPVTTGHRRHP